MTNATDAARDAPAERLFGSVLGAIDLLAIYLGDELGFCQALAAGGAMTSSELAMKTSADERYTREWLEQQAVTGILHSQEGETSSDRRVSLSDGHAQVLVEPENLAAMTPPARFLAGIAGVLPDLLAAYRSGEGVPYRDYGQNGCLGQAGMTRPMFANLLGNEWIPTLTDIDARLRAEPSARVVDIGCGAGWSSIALARAYPLIRIDGLDLDEPSIAAARANAAAAGVADRVTFQVRDAGDPELAGKYDLACAFECIHDMANPVAALASMRRLVGANGSVLIADERVAELFTAPGDDIERFMNGFSILHCLPVGRAEQPSAATGAVMRESTFRDYASRAGFGSVEVTPIAHDWWRFYRLSA